MKNNDKRKIENKKEKIYDFTDMLEGTILGRYNKKEIKKYTKKNPWSENYLETAEYLGNYKTVVLEAAEVMTNLNKDTSRLEEELNELTAFPGNSKLVTFVNDVQATRKEIKQKLNLLVKDYSLDFVDLNKFVETEHNNLEKTQANLEDEKTDNIMKDVYDSAIIYATIMSSISKLGKAFADEQFSPQSFVNSYKTLKANGEETKTILGYIVSDTDFEKIEKAATFVENVKNFDNLNAIMDKYDPSLKIVAEDHNTFYSFITEMRKYIGNEFNDQNKEHLKGIIGRLHYKPSSQEHFSEEPLRSLRRIWDDIGTYNETYNN